MSDDHPSNAPPGQAHSAHASSNLFPYIDDFEGEYPLYTPTYHAIYDSDFVISTDNFFGVDGSNRVQNIRSNMRFLELDLAECEEKGLIPLHHPTGGAQLARRNPRLHLDPLLSAASLYTSLPRTYSAPPAVLSVNNVPSQPAAQPAAQPASQSVSSQPGPSQPFSYQPSNSHPSIGNFVNPKDFPALGDRELAISSQSAIQPDELESPELEEVPRPVAKKRKRQSKDDENIDVEELEVTHHSRRRGQQSTGPSSKRVSSARAARSTNRRRTAGTWSDDECNCCIRLVKRAIDNNECSTREAIWPHVSGLMRLEGFMRSTDAVKNYWARYLRASSGIDERKHKREDAMSTGIMNGDRVGRLSAQGKRQKTKAAPPTSNDAPGTLGLQQPTAAPPATDDGPDALSLQQPSAAPAQDSMSPSPDPSERMLTTEEIMRIFALDRREASRMPKIPASYATPVTAGSRVTVNTPASTQTQRQAASSSAGPGPATASYRASRLAAARATAAQMPTDEYASGAINARPQFPAPFPAGAARRSSGKYASGTFYTQPPVPTSSARQPSPIPPTPSPVSSPSAPPAKVVDIIDLTGEDNETGEAFDAPYDYDTPVVDGAAEGEPDRTTAWM